MAYDNPPPRRYAAEDRQADYTTQAGFGDQPTFRGHPGFREDPSFGSGYQAAAGYQPAATGYQGAAAGYGGYPAGPAGYPSAAGEEDRRTPVSSAELEEVFDEPDDRAGRDRLAVHWLWEMLLLIGVGALVYLLWQAEPGALRGGQLSLLLTLAAGYGLLGLAAGVTLRTGVPNLAIGPVAVAAAVYYAQNGGDGVAVAAGTAAVAAVALGVAMAFLVLVFHVPGWAASLAAATAAVVWLQLQPAEIDLAGGYNPTSQAAFLLALVAAMGILGGLLGTLRGIRRTVGRTRPTGDPARRLGVVAGLVSSGAIVISMAMAAVAGVLLVSGLQEPIGPGRPVEGASGATWLTWTAIGFGVALIGGTSAFGRRGGVFGTVLAALALTLFHEYQFQQGWAIALLATAGVAVAGGLVVTRLIEIFGGPPAGGHDDPQPPVAAAAASNSGQWETSLPARSAEPAIGRHAEPATAADSWHGSAADSWSSALPARPAPNSNSDPWDDDRWSRR